MYFAGVPFSEVGQPQFYTRLKLRLDRFVSSLEARRLWGQTSGAGLVQTSGACALDVGGRTVGTAREISAHLERTGGRGSHTHTQRNEKHNTGIMRIIHSSRVLVVGQQTTSVYTVSWVYTVDSL